MAVALRRKPYGRSHHKRILITTTRTGNLNVRQFEVWACTADRFKDCVHGFGRNPRIATALVLTKLARKIRAKRGAFAAFAGYSKHNRRARRMRRSSKRGR